MSSSDLCSKIEAYFLHSHPQWDPMESRKLLREALQALKEAEKQCRGLQNDVRAILHQAISEIGNEKLAGNIVKEEFWKGERSVANQILCAIEREME